MKRILSLLLCLTMLAVCLPLAAQAGSYAVVNNPNPADRLHLREKPDENSTSLGKYYNGTKAEVLKDDGKTWVEVRIGSDGGTGVRTGYMKRQYLAMGKAADKVASAMPRYLSTSSAWELYNVPGKTGDTRMHGYGEEILLMGFTPDWWHLYFPETGLTGFVQANAACIEKPWTAVVNNPNPSDRLNLRTKADKNAASLGKYYNGVAVTVIGWHGELNYAKVEIGSLTGYMDAQYLASGQDMKKVKSAIPTVKVKNPVATQQLNLRQSQSETSASLGKYSNGTEVKVLGVGPTWYHVEVNGKKGFMMMKYLSPTLPK